MNNTGLTDVQRTKALQSIADLRATAPLYLDAAEKIITQNCSTQEIADTALQGTRVSTINLLICKALWAIEEARAGQRWAVHASIMDEQG